MISQEGRWRKTMETAVVQQVAEVMCYMKREKNDIVRAGT